MTTKTRTGDEQDGTPADEPTPVFDQALNPSGVPGETPAGATPDASVEAVNEAGGEQVQSAFDEAAEKGYFGETPDQTDRERYTLRGQSQG
jgi:hypothetical protein